MDEMMNPEMEAPEMEAPEMEAHEAEAAEAPEAEAAEAPDFENNSHRFDEDEFNASFGTDLSGLSIDPSTVTKRTFSFDAADVSMLLDKSLQGDVRQIEVNANTPFFRNIPVNNYPGPGDLTQGTIENAVAQPGEDNIPTPVDGYIQVLAPDGTPNPNSRQLSNTLGDQGDSFTPEEAGYNNLFMGTGQYIDHGLDLIPKADKTTPGGQQKMEIFLPDDDILNGRGFDFKGNPVSKLSLLDRALPDEGTDEPLKAEYTNSKTPFADQDQTYGATEMIHFLIREKTEDGAFTMNLLDNEISNQSELKVFQEYGDQQSDSLATIYDVVVNSAKAFGHEKAELITKIETTLENPEWQQADQVLRAWDEKVRNQDFSRTVTGNPRMDSVEIEGETFSVMDAITTLGEAQEELNEEINTDKFSLNTVFTTLVGDASPLARYSPYSVLAHQVSGDPRTNENVQLSAISNVFAANHNNLAGQITDTLGRIRAQYSGDDAEIPVGLENVVHLANGHSFDVKNEAGEVIRTISNEQAIFDMARTVNNAAYQRMIYDQYVVHLAGGIHFGITSSQDKDLMPNKDQILPQDINVNEHGFNGVNPEVNPSVSLGFSGSAFRVGHSQIYPDLNGIKLNMPEELLEFGEVIERSLIEGFVQPTAIRKMGGSAGVLAQNAHDRAMAIDTYVVDEVRNMLIGQPNDLLAFNSERQYDLGLATLQETRQALSDLFRDTGVANAKGAGASDASAGVFEHGTEHNELAERLKPYKNWGDFKENLRDESLVELFMAQFGGAEAALDNDYGLINIPLYIGGLAEKQTDTPNGEGRENSLMGEVFTFLITTAFDEFQDPDEEYYKISIPGSDILKQLGHQTWTPMIQTALGLEAQAIHQDTFRVAKTDVLEEGEANFTAPEEHDFDGRAFNRIIYGNTEDNSITGSEGKSSELASSESYASDDIRAGAGDDYVNALGGEDWVYGQAGDDTLSGGDDHAIDHVFGGEGKDKLLGYTEDALFGDEDDDLLIRKDGTGFHDGGLGHDIVLAGDSIDVVQGDSGEAYGENVDGNDILFGGRGSDEVAGEGGHDLVVGGDSGRMSEDPIGDRLYGDAVAATHNAELLARAIRDENGKIVNTIVPLKSELGYGVLVGGVNPLTGGMFSEADIREFKEYIEVDLRKVVDINDPAGRGPRPTMVVMPYAGPTGNDIIYTGRHSDIQSELGHRVDAEELISWMQRNGYAEAAEVEAPEAEAPEAEAEGAEAPEAEGAEAPEAEGAEAEAPEAEAPEAEAEGAEAPEAEGAEAPEAEGAEAEEAEAPEAEGAEAEGAEAEEAEAPEAAEAEGAEAEAPEAEAPEAEAAVEAEVEDLRIATDLVFADAGDDIIHTDGHNSTYVFGGQGYDTLISNLDSYNAPLLEVEAEEAEAPEAEAEEAEAPEAEAEEAEAPEAEGAEAEGAEAPEAEGAEAEEAEAPEAEGAEAPEAEAAEAPAFDFSGGNQAEAEEAEAPEAEVAEAEAPEAEGAEAEAPEAEGAEAEAPEAEAAEAPAFDFSGANQAEAPEAEGAEAEAPEAEGAEAPEAEGAEAPEAEGAEAEAPEAEGAEAEAPEAEAGESPGMSMYVDSLNAWGADGVVSRSGVERSESQDHFFSMEHVVLDKETHESQSNSLSVNDATQPVTLDFRQSQWGRNAVLSTTDETAKGLEVSNVNHFDLAKEVGYQGNEATLQLAGKLDYDGKLDSDKSDDNYKISWDGDSLKVKSRSTGNISLDGVKNIEFYHPTVDHLSESFYYKEFADKALELNLNLVKNPVTAVDGQNEVVLRQWGTEAEVNSDFYLALTAKSLREGATIDTLDVSLSLDEQFSEVFQFNQDKVWLRNQFRVDDDLHEKPHKNQSRVLFEDNTIRFSGSGLNALQLGEGIDSDESVLAYIGLDKRNDINDLIKGARTIEDGKVVENFSQDLTFKSDANVDSVTFSDLYSLRDLGDKHALMNEDLSINVRAAAGVLESDGKFDLGTYREITKSGESSVTNLVREGETINQSNTWTNEGEFTFTDLTITSESQDGVVAVESKFDNNQTALGSLGWESSNSVTVNTEFKVAEDAAGKVIDTSTAGYKLEANGGYSWDTRATSSFQTKHLVTFQGDLNYDGRVSMKDLGHVNAGAKLANDGYTPSDVDANYDGMIDIKDLGVIDADWNRSLHSGDEAFAGVEGFSMDSLFKQGSNSWDSNNYTLQGAIETGMLDAESAFVEDLDHPTEGSNTFLAKGLNEDVVQLWQDQYGMSES